MIPSLANPAWLILLPLPWLLWRFASTRRPPALPPEQAGRQAAIYHPQAALLIRLSHEQERRPPWFWLLGCMLLILALTRPQWPQTDPHQGRNFMLAIDLSSSMKARDFILNGQPVTRIEAVRQVAHDFIEQRQGDRIGLIVFADDAYTLAPINRDSQLNQQLLADISHGIVGAKTALGQAIALGTRRLQDLDPQSRNLILLTDGSNTSGDIHPQHALQMARSQGIRIYTIGIGRRSGQVMFERGPAAAPTLESIPLDEALLQQLAEATGGRYYHASDTPELGAIMDDIEQQETITIDDIAQPPQELYPWPLLAGLLLLSSGHWRQQRRRLP